MTGSTSWSVSMTAGSAVPALVVAAVAHAEIATARPFVRGNGVVARAVERALVQATGLDPTGVVVTEAGHATQGGPAYLGALAAYGTGTPEGLGLWIGHCADAIVAGAAQGEQICDAVRAGRLTWPEPRGHARTPTDRVQSQGFPLRRSGGTHGGKSTDVSPTTTVTPSGTHARAVHWWTDRDGLVPVRQLQKARLVTRGGSRSMAPRRAGCHPSVRGGLHAMSVLASGADATPKLGPRNAPDELRLKGKWSTMKSSAPPCG